jgi:SOS-response transcriptional repressor LexA
MLTGKELGRAIETAIKLKMDSAGISKTSIANHFGIKPPSIYDWINKGSISKDKLPELWRFFSDVVGPEHWGLRSWPEPIKNDHRVTKPEIPFGIPVPVFDADASMGPGKAQPENDTIVGSLQLNPAWVRQQLPSISSPTNLAVLTAYGDSMEPTFRDGDMLLVDRGSVNIDKDAVFVLAFNQELFIKRVQRRPFDGALVIKSDNPLYDPHVLSNGERASLQVLGRVVWAWNGKKL